MIALGIASVMLCLGFIIRSKVKFISNMLMPTSVIAGILGFIVMNTGLITSVSSELYVNMVNILFTITFISIGLTSSPKTNSDSLGKTIMKGSFGLGFVWNTLYALTPAVGAVIILFIGKYFSMDPVYGLLIPFAFAQGPGQAATFGTIMSNEHGFTDAATVGITFAAIGFLICFLVGVPLAKYGIKKGLAKNIKKTGITGHVARGYYLDEEQNESMGNETMFSGNLDTMTFHFAIIGICFLLATGMANLVSLIPGVGPTFGGMLFIYGMVAAYLVKSIMKKLNISFLLDNTFQSKFTGWSTDYLIVASFMSIPLGVIGDWLIPIIIASIIITILTFIICIYFGQRLGSEHDFERTLGMFGTATGTTPSGIALVRIIDPSLKTPTSVELGLMNVIMTPSYVTVLTIFGIASGVLSFNMGILLLLAPIPIYLIVLKVFGVWGRKSYSLNSKSINKLNRMEKVKVE